MPTGRPKTHPAGSVIVGYPATAAGDELLPENESPLTRSVMWAGPFVRTIERVELVSGKHRVDALLPHEIAALRQRLEIGLVGERALLGRLLHDLLTEERHLTVGVLQVEGDEILQRPHRRPRPRREVGLEIGFELVEKDLVFCVVRLAEMSEIRPDR